MPDQQGALINVHFHETLVTGQRNPAFGVGLQWRDELQWLGDELRNLLYESGDFDALLRIAPGVRTFLGRIRHPQRCTTQFIRVFEEVVDDNQ